MKRIIATLVLFFVYLIQPLYAVGAIVQSVCSADFLNSTTFTATYASNLTLGNLLIACTCSWRDGTDQTLSSMTGGTGAWTQAFVMTRIDSQVICYEYYKANTAADTAPTITATWSVAATGTLGIAEYSGIETAPTETSNINNGSSTAVTSGAISPADTYTAAGCFGHNITGVTVTTDAGSNQRLECDEDNSNQITVLSDAFGVSGSKNMAWTISGTGTWTAGIAGYTESGGAAPAPKRLTLLGAGD